MSVLHSRRPSREWLHYPEGVATKHKGKRARKLSGERGMGKGFTCLGTVAQQEGGKSLGQRLQKVAVVGGLSNYRACVMHG